MNKIQKNSSRSRSHDHAVDGRIGTAITCVHYKMLINMLSYRVKMINVVRAFIKHPENKRGQWVKSEIREYELG